MDKDEIKKKKKKENFVIPRDILECIEPVELRVTDHDFPFCHKLPYKDVIWLCALIMNIALPDSVSFYSPACFVPVKGTEKFSQWRCYLASRNK